VADVLSIEEALSLLKPQAQLNAPVQNSKYIKYYESTFRCASRGCSCPTAIKVQGVPYCGPHTIIALCRILESLDPSDEIVHEHIRFVPPDEGR
jgi:hypothetical protein